MRKILIAILIKLLRKQNREIHKMAPDEELKAYRFMNPEDVLKLIKANTTAQMLYAFEANDDKSKYREQGATLVLQTMKNAHLQAKELFEVFSESPEEREKHWMQYRKTTGTRIK